MKVLIIEDEPFAQNELKRLLVNTGRTVQVLDCIDSIEDAVAWLRTNDLPDLIFLDIQLSDGLSFEIFNQVKVTAPVIFTTAYDEYAIEAFQLNSIDYLLKPIKPQKLDQALNKFEQLGEQFSSKQQTFTQTQLESLLNLNKPRYKSRFLVKLGDQIMRVDVDDVAYFKAEDNEVIMVTFANRQFVIDHSLEQLGDMLDPSSFFRVNRSYFVSVNAIAKVSKYFNSRLHLVLTPETSDQVLISRVKVPEFLKWMDD